MALDLALAMARALALALDLAPAMMSNTIYICKACNHCGVGMGPCIKCGSSSVEVECDESPEEE